MQYLITVFQGTDPAEPVRRELNPVRRLDFFDNEEKENIDPSPVNKSCFLKKSKANTFKSHARLTDGLTMIKNG